MSAAEAESLPHDQPHELTAADPGDVQLHLDVNGLYIILSTQEANIGCHWVLYLHIGSALGWVFHINNLGCVSWEYRCDESRDMAYSTAAVAAVKIADMAPEMHEALRRRIGFDSKPAVELADTARFGRLDCRTWLLQVLYELDNEGYISVLPGYSIHDLAEEATSLAAANQFLLQEKTAKISELRKEIISACCAP
ncbi:hypothetical protein MY5147_005547 [Beauveria neobassiana]|uniref:Uncharacterized protein n=1 Tax=Beauveria bassiana TaxID=176275 RepID=A0A2S7XWI9_BEABA|nr:hypothetical protein BB8028_0001g02230 [Beauveria bassiana]